MEHVQASVQEASGRNVILSPDPTLLTGQAVTAAKEDLRRDMAALQALLESRITDALTLIQTRLDIIEHMDTLRRQERELAIQHVREVVQEQHSTAEVHRVRLEQEFAEAMAQHLLIRQETRGMIDAAIATQKEAINVQTNHMTLTVNRIELMATRQLEQITILLQTASSGLQSKIDDVKERLTLLEGRTAGITAGTTMQREVTKEQREGSQFLLAILGFVAGTMIGIIGIVLALFKV